MKNWKAWALVGLLAVVVLVGGGVLVVSYQSRLPAETRWVTLLPRNEWGFRRFSNSMFQGTKLVYSEEWTAFGFFTVRTKRTGSPARYFTSMRDRTTGLWGK
jgi:hypothetical protein